MSRNKREGYYFGTLYSVWIGASGEMIRTKRQSRTKLKFLSLKEWHKK